MTAHPFKAMWALSPLTLSSFLTLVIPLSLSAY
ncbi:hypothetical protein PanWU01x14_184060 [Parasponia andersonii]|uniref:Uncharacterized protein n=1 Tax=Parasponia andersonii TaxID=3476 RepID=A0A2P5C4S0_PARAD|nr:hypothetical protein PanWU01x14_184060 [Parasponia andersonii]